MQRTSRGPSKRSGTARVPTWMRAHAVLVVTRNMATSARAGLSLG